MAKEAIVKKINLLGFLAASLLFSGSLAAAAPDLADKPLASGTSGEVKPNVMFILDDSGSMGWTHLPDHVRGLRTDYGYKSAQCNGIYYNPSVTYKAPVKADGTSYPDVDFYNAPYDGFDSGSVKKNLSSQFRAYDDITSYNGGDDSPQAAYYYSYSGAQAALAYTYDSDGDVRTTTTFYKECNSPIDETPGKNVFTKVTVGAGERQNFANWYSYYRVRIYSAKTALGRAVASLSEPSKYRLGYTTHSYTGTNSANDEFQKINDFCGASDGCTQRIYFYNKLYGASASGGTPLRAALSKVGKMYAGKLLTGVDDPMQYSCQQNFTILATDGFWNGDAGYKLDNGSIGNQDGGTTARPMLDSLNKSGTLADVAMYYYQTDLRDTALSNCTGAEGKDVCENNVPGAGYDKAPTQHMTTFTLGLGVDGSLKYCENYEAGGCADYVALTQGTKNWPDPTDSEDLHRVDDLWHAAVNGRGKYFSAKSPESLASGVQKALAGVSARTASAAAAATSNLEPVAGDNYAYVAMYTTVDWDGDLEAREIDLSVGTVSETAMWSAKTKLGQLVSAGADSRNIYFNKSGTLKPFSATNLTTQITSKYFEPGLTNPNGALSQYAALSSTDQALATQESVINYLRGWSQYEDESSNSYKLYRDRKHALGDIVNAAPVFMSKPPFGYTDANYATFADNNKTRQSVVYAGGNDGMLHAFNGETGVEMWAFVPSAVIPNLYKLADKSYGTNHRFYVDGPITVGDVCLATTCAANQWKTMLVGGLGKGGRSYYALDVTNPSSPAVLWEFTNPNLGYSFGNALITKRNGTWVVIVASGYDNGAGDGKGHLFVLDARDGSILADIVTDNSVTNPALSGIGKINSWVDNGNLDNSTRYVYGGDLSGNLWRFDIEAGIATKLATLGGVAPVGVQPITTKPELAEVSVAGIPTRLVMVGTGRYLGTTDVGSKDRMSFYVLKEDLTSSYGVVRSDPRMVEQQLTGTVGSRQLTYTEMLSTNIGWYMDFDAEDGERVNVDPKYQVGWLALPTNVPNPNVCNIGGTSWLYFLNPWPTKSVAASTAELVNIGNSLIVGINTIRLPTGKVVTIVTTSDAKYPVVGNPSAPPAGSLKRVNWRTLTTEKRK